MGDVGSGTGAGAGGGSKSDVERLHELGYAQELKRGMSGFSNFAVSFTIISILSGCLTLFGFGMAIGGPISSTYGWLLVGVMVTFVGLVRHMTSVMYRALPVPHDAGNGGTT